MANNNNSGSRSSGGFIVIAMIGDRDGILWSWKSRKNGRSKK